ncbi:MAG: autotransporter-associated beta strand repeat-containing protein [Phycisphaerales bacterium]
MRIRATTLLATLCGTAVSTGAVRADTWDNSAGSAQWSTASNWADNTEPTINDAVVFPSPIPLNQATVLMTTTEFASTLTFNHDYTLQGGQMFVGAGTINVAGGRTATINTVINGSAGLSKTGFGTLRLLPVSSNSFSGPISITGINSTLYVRSNVALGNTANDIDINAGRLQLDGVTSPTFLVTGRTITPGSSGGTVELLNNAFLDLNTALGANAFGLTFTGQGTVELNTSSARTGPTFVSGVLLRLNGATALGTPGSASLTNGAVLEINNGSGLFGGTVAAGAGTTVRGGAGTHTFAGVANVGGSMTLSGGLAGSDTLILSGDVLRLGAGLTTTVGEGKVRLDSANSFAGGWAVQGVLEVRHEGALGTGTTPVAVNGSGRLQLNTPVLSRDITLNNPGGGLELLQDATVHGHITTPGASGFVPFAGHGLELTLDGPGSSFTYNGLLYFGGVSGVRSLRVTGGAAVTGTGTRMFGDAGQAARLTVSGPGTSWVNSTEMWIGWSGGAGQLTLDGGATLSCPQVYIAQQGDASATVTGAGSLMTCGDKLVVGFGAVTGTLAVLDGAEISATQVRVGELGAATGTVSVGGAGSTLTSAGAVVVGTDATGGVGVTDGGSVVCGGLVLGDGAGSSGVCTVTGGLTRLECGSGGVALGLNGAVGELHLPGGIVDIQGDITDGGAGTSTFVLDGATLDMHGHAIGGVSPIDLASFRSGTLKNVSQVNNGMGINKDGTGTLFLNTTNAYTGGTTVSRGTLYLVESGGSNTGAGTVVVGESGTLAGNGRVGGPLLNDGVVSPQGFGFDSIATLRVLGVYTQIAGGTLEVQIGTGGGHDALEVSGGAVLSGTLHVTLINGYAPAAGEVFDILSSASVNGTFGVTGLPALADGLFWQVEYLAGGVRLSVLGGCDSIDFNNDGLYPDTTDIDDMLSVFSGGPCSNDPVCHDIDFNNDGLYPDTADIDSMLSVFSGGPCL